jgi:glycosyltransferase involved in cell wall biosynthesis
MKAVVGFDARMLRPNASGVGTYILGILEGFRNIEFPSNLEIAVIGPESCRAILPQLEMLRFIPCEIPPLSIQEQMLFPGFLKRHDIRFLHCPHFNVPLFYQGYLIVTIHDLIPLRFPRASSIVHRMAFRLLCLKGCAKADSIIASSRHTQSDLETLGVAREKIHVIPLGVRTLPEVSYQTQLAVLSKYGITSPFLLYVGNLKPHKNSAFLLSLQQALREDIPGIQLVLVGRMDRRYTELTTALKSSEAWGVHVLGYLPLDELAALVRSASVFLFPSLYEGFGIPPLEAMLCGTPVVASNCTSIPEVLGDAAVLLNPTSIPDWKTVVHQLMTNPQYRQEMIEKGLRRAIVFSWEATARKIARMYEKSISSA